MECTICYETVDNNKTNLSCKHPFHKDCLKEWIFAKSENSDSKDYEIKFTCPTCRKKYIFTDNDNFEIYNFITFEEKMYNFFIFYTIFLIAVFYCIFKFN
jgi:hypothetical protein